MKPRLYDDKGNQYKAVYTKIANHRRDYGEQRDVPLIADTDMDMKIAFENISTQATSVSLLFIEGIVYLNDNHEEIGVEFRDVPIQK